MSQTSALWICAIVLIATIASWIYFIYRSPFHSDWGAIAIPVIMTALLFTAALWSLDDNFYDVKSGMVVGQEFTPGHYEYVLVGKVLTPQWKPDDWAIAVRSDDGHVAWFHYRNDVFAQYPYGSTYP